MAAPLTPAVAGTAVVAALVVAATLLEVFEVMLLPRRVRRRQRVVRVFFHVTWRAWRALAHALPRTARAGALGAYGPLAMIGLLAVWTFVLVTGLGVLQWALAQGAPKPPALLTQLYFSGVTFFTLGLGDVTAPTRAGKVLSVVEAGTGFGFIAVTIGYLPVLYQLFSQRETFVIRLDPRAGSPPTAVALLERHAGSAGLASLTTLLAQWEEWAATMLESHLAYPMLAYYRSQHDNESWLAALVAVTDACALLLVGVAPRDGVGGDVAAFQARMTFAGARMVLVEMASALAPELVRGTVRAAGASRDRVVGDAVRDVIAPGSATHPPSDAVGTASREEDDAARLPLDARLDASTLARLRPRLEQAGYALPADLSDDVARLRAGYEPYAVALARYLALPLPAWLPDDRAADNWEHGAGGGAARRTVAEAERRAAGSPP